MDRRLVDHLVNSNLVSRAAMQRMILRATKDKTGVVEQLLDDSKVDENEVAKELAAYFDLEVLDLTNFSVSDTALKFISKNMADKNGVLPYAVSNSADEVSIAVFNPEAAQSVIDSLKTATGKNPTVVVAPRAWLKQAIRHFYFGEPWSAAPAHRAATREVQAVVRELADDSSSEIVLDEVVMPPAPKSRPKQKAKSRASRDSKATPVPQEAPKPQRSSSSGKALDEFDDFLNSATGWGKNNSSGIPGWEDDEPQGRENPFAREDDGWSDPSPGAFSLFDDKSEVESLDLTARILEQEQAIERLSRDLQQSRDIISALVDALADANVVSKRDIKARVKRK